MRRSRARWPTCRSTSQFSGLHNGVISIAVGSGGRGYSGVPDVTVTTDANGAFTVAPPSTGRCRKGFQYVAAVVVGQPDSPPLPGLSGPIPGQPTYTDAFRIDKTPPQITGASFTQGGATLPLPGSPQPNITDVPALTTLTLNVIDYSNPSPLGLDDVRHARLACSSTRSTRRPPPISATTR